MLPYFFLLSNGGTLSFLTRGKQPDSNSKNSPIYSDNSKEETNVTKYIFVTGGVVSSIGKGITAASLGRLLKNRGLSVTIQKFDPYINVDPGTMSPYQHGEVFVTDDGAETDLDLGHYERFIDINLNQNSNVTTGKIYSEVLKKRTPWRLFGRNSSSYPAYYK